MESKTGSFCILYAQQEQCNKKHKINETNNQVSVEVVSFGSLLNVSCTFTNKKQRKKKLQSRLNLQHITIS